MTIPGDLIDRTLGRLAGVMCPVAAWLEGIPLHRGPPAVTTSGVGPDSACPWWKRRLSTASGVRGGLGALARDPVVWESKHGWFLTKEVLSSIRYVVLSVNRFVEHESFHVLRAWSRRLCVQHGLLLGICSPWRRGKLILSTDIKKVACTSNLTPLCNTVNGSTHITPVASSMRHVRAQHMHNSRTDT